MTNEPTIQQRLVEPFPPEEIKQRPGRGNMTFSYVDAPAVMHRLDEVVGLHNWQTTFQVINLQESVVECTLQVRIDGEWITKTDAGYPNSDNDDEPLKSAYSDALKRAAVQFGIGRHLREKTQPQTRQPQRPVQAAQAPSAPPPASPTALLGFDVDELKRLVKEAGMTNADLVPITGAGGNGGPRPMVWLEANPGKTMADLVKLAFDTRQQALHDAFAGTQVPA